MVFGLLLGFSLLILYFGAKAQIDKCDAWRGKYKQLIVDELRIDQAEVEDALTDSGAKSDLLEKMTERAYSDPNFMDKMNKLQREYIDIRLQIKAEWEHSAASHLLLAPGSYLGTFVAPENITSGRTFRPGVIEVVLLILAGFILSRAGSRKRA